jgi:glycosidase
MIKKLTVPVLILMFLAGISCSPKQRTENLTKEPVFQHADWTKNANIYEVNIRQYTDEGTFNAFAKEIPRLKDMGVDILWIMPINPVGEKNRKGSLGSYYAVKDYQKVNPEFGTLDDFKNLVKQAHELDMKVIVDWVANHTSWDNWLIGQHADWYTHDSTGQIIPSVPDWSDVADLNYDVPALRQYMIQSMEYWIKEADIDGYRCDVAGMVPLDFWIDARKDLETIKPVFMLAEWEAPEAHLAFDMTYGWEFHHIMNQVAQKKEPISAIDKYFAKMDTTYKMDDYRMMFTSNHDENSWNGTEYERMGDAAVNMAVLSATVPGMPLIYTGQEAKSNKRLKFFDKDTIAWGNYTMAPVYKNLLELKKDHQALWNGNYGGTMTRISTAADSVVYSFERTKNQDKVLVFLNFSGKEQTFSINDSVYFGKYISLFAQKKCEISKDYILKLAPWGYEILTIEL